MAAVATNAIDKHKVESILTVRKLCENESTRWGLRPVVLYVQPPLSDANKGTVITG